MPTSDFDARSTELDAYQIERLRERTKAIASRLRRMADDIDRTAELDDIFKIPGEVAYTIAWGIANANIDGPSQQIREIVISRNANDKLRKEQDRV